MNFTKPHDENYNDTPEDYLFLASTFGKALGILLEKGHGILIDLPPAAMEIRPDANRVVIFNDGNMVRVVAADERTDLYDGDRIMMIDGNSLNN